MKKQMKYFLTSILIILFSTPLGYSSLNIVYYNKNLTGEFVTILEGFIHSYMLIGILIFSIGLIDMLSSNYSKK